MLKIYRYIANFDTGKKRIDLLDKDIELAYNSMVMEFGNVGFKEIHFSRVINK